MKNRLEHILEFFPTGTAEGERDILDRVFVYVDEFSKVIAPPKGSPNILVGSKGSGKTAVLNFSARMLDAQNIPNIALTPIDIDSSSMDQNDSTGDLARAFYKTLLEAIVTKLSQKSTGWFDDDYATLYYHAEGQGLRSPDFLTRSTRFISEIAKPIIKIDVNAAFPHLIKSTQDDVEEAVKGIVGRTGFYVFIDDTDQVARPGVAGHLNRVWALLLAARRLTYDVANLNAVVSLRTEVWHRLQRDDYGQRDQTDHFRRLVVNMHGDEQHVGKIIDRRLALAAASARAPVDGFQHFFDGSDARAPMSKERKLWRDLILVRTRSRPRDAIQLINELATEAIRRGEERITEDVFRHAMPPFSRTVSEQLAEEVRPEFPQALEYLKSLADIEYSQGGFTMTAEETRTHFRRMLSRFGATLHGVSLSQERPESIFAIWRLFYQVGVLNARVSDTSKPQGYSHLDPNLDPFLVSRSRWNEIQGILWEVNTAYRDYLIEIQKELGLRSGLAQKPKGKRR